MSQSRMKSWKTGPVGWNLSVLSMSGRVFGAWVLLADLIPFLSFLNILPHYESSVILKLWKVSRCITYSLLLHRLVPPKFPAVCRTCLSPCWRSWPQLSASRPQLENPNCPAILENYLLNSFHPCLLFHNFTCHLELGMNWRWTPIHIILWPPQGQC